VSRYFLTDLTNAEHTKRPINKQGAPAHMT